MTAALKTSRPPTYRWVPVALVVVVLAAAPLGWYLFGLVSA